MSCDKSQFLINKHMKKSIIITLLLISLSNVFSQFSNKHFKKIPSEFSNKYLITHEIEAGRRLSYKSFKAGKFESATDSEIKNLMNTMLLGSATHLFDYLNVQYSDFSPEVIKSNGFTSTTFYIKYNLKKEKFSLLGQ